jgi:hypothetical protein
MDEAATKFESVNWLTTEECVRRGVPSQHVEMYKRYHYQQVLPPSTRQRVSEREGTEKEIPCDVWHLMDWAGVWVRRMAGANRVTHISHRAGGTERRR